MSNNENQSYYNNIRAEIAEYIRKNNNYVLDVGCGAGNFGKYLKQTGRAVDVTGIEINETAAVQAETKLDKVFCIDLNLSSIDSALKNYNKSSFDYIVCADVLEHLIDPWKILQELVEYLKPGGHIVISIPNVRHWSVLLPLIFYGHWRYVEEGIMDRTHLRFFTRKSAFELVQDSGLQVTKVDSIVYRKIDKIGIPVSFGLLKGIFAFQWILIGEKKNKKFR